MIDLKLNQDNDIDFQNNDIQMVSDVDEIIQNIKVILRTRLGEFFGDAEMGLDYSDILGKNYSEQYAVASIMDALLEDNRVSSVTDVNLTVQSRQLFCEVDFMIDQSVEARTEVSIDVE